MKPPSLAPSTRLRLWWDALAPRERWMLATMAAMLAAFAFWYGLFLPLRAAAEAARLRHGQAVAELARVRAEVDAIAALQDRSPTLPADSGALRAAVVDAASQAGLPVSRQRGEDAGRLGIESDAASAPQLFGFLDHLRQRHGLAPATLSVARSEGRLRVQAVFEVTTALDSTAAAPPAPMTAR